MESNRWNKWGEPSSREDSSHSSLSGDEEGRKVVRGILFGLAGSAYIWGAVYVIYRFIKGVI